AGDPGAAADAEGAGEGLRQDVDLLSQPRAAGEIAEFRRLLQLFAEIHQALPIGGQRLGVGDGLADLRWADAEAARLGLLPWRRSCARLAPLERDQLEGVKRSAGMAQQVRQVEQPLGVRAAKDRPSRGDGPQLPLAPQRRAPQASTL